MQRSCVQQMIGSGHPSLCLGILGIKVGDIKPWTLLQLAARSTFNLGTEKGGLQQMFCCAGTST